MGYRLWIKDEAKTEAKDLPGHVRQLIRRAIGGLAADPRPHDSRELGTPEGSIEARRLRVDRWRVVYVVDDQWQDVGVLAVRRRPPYDYNDLSELLSELD
jgi:mRNA-degrading endonuclease RelE of RelBE toxin-antitoxin system